MRIRVPVFLGFLLLCVLPCSAVTVTVPNSWTAAGWWVDTGLDLSAGDTIHVTASGSWFPAGAVTTCGPDGSTTLWFDNFLNPYDTASNAVTDHFGALIGYIGSTPPVIGAYNGRTVEQRQVRVHRMVLLGSDATVTVPTGGRLWLGMNDDAYNANVSDNAGSISATVRRVKAMNPSNEHWYEAVAVPEGITWPQARDAASALGGYLAAITSADENSFVYNLAAENDSCWQNYNAWELGPFIGGFQPEGATEPDGGWEWVTGEPCTYSNWSPHAFDMAIAEAENCAQYATWEGEAGGTWNDVSDTSTQKGYVAEFAVNPILNPQNGHYYEIILGYYNWTEAKQLADQRRFNGLSGHLATITSAEEDNWIHDNLVVPSGLTDIWIGAYQDHLDPAYSEPGGGWKWVTTEPWSYTNWADGQPNDSGGPQDFAHVFNAGSWEDIRDDSYHTYIRVQAYLVEYEADTAGPMIAITSPTTSPTFTSPGAGVDLAGTASDDLEVAGVTWSTDGGYSGTCVGSNMWSINGIALHNGTNTITVTAHDLAGNTASDTLTVTYFPILTDNFDDNTTDTRLWQFFMGGSGPQAAEVNHRLEVTFPPESSGSMFMGGYLTRPLFRGDFDVQVDYECMDWPDANGVRLGPGLFSFDGAGFLGMQRVSYGQAETSGPYEYYTAADNDSGIGSGAATSDLSGSMRLVRSGSAISCYYRQGGRWIKQYTYPSSRTVDVHVEVKAWSHDYAFVDKTVRVGFDNFTVSYGQMLPLYPAAPTVGGVKLAPDGTQVYVEDAVVTADSTLVPGAVFVEAPDRSAGIKLVTGQPLSIGQRLALTGTVRRVDGEWQIDAGTVYNLSDGAPLAPLCVTTPALANDRSEDLNYLGINTTGLLVRAAGKVSAVIPGENVIYLNDGGPCEDGLGPFYGIRVYLPPGMTLPSKGSRATIAGISRVEKRTLTTWGEVNGLWYPAGTVIYVPSIWVRDAGDVF